MKPPTAAIAIVLAFTAGPTITLANTHKEAPQMAASEARGRHQAKSQRTRTKQCNADAAGRKGDDRKAFMKTCLSA